MKNYRKIVLTGGPCGGKTTILSELYGTEGIVIIPETASMFIAQGLTPENCGALEYQTQHIALQEQKESSFENLTKLQSKKKLLICERGLADGIAFLPDKEYRKLESQSDIPFYARYDCVIFVETVARLGEKYYDEYNEGRKKTAQDAIKIEDRLYNEWKRNKSFYYVKAIKDLSVKVEQIREILTREAKVL